MAGYETPRACTECGKRTDVLTWFPFATYACEECARKIRELVDEQRRTGDVCLICGTPRRLCTC